MPAAGSRSGIQGWAARKEVPSLRAGGRRSPPGPRCACEMGDQDPFEKAEDGLADLPALLLYEAHG